MKSATDVTTAVAHPEAPGRARVRDRIFDTACEMFYRLGIRAVGVDAIACEAQTNKMSFYRSFPSKDELVAEYLRDAEQRFWSWWDAAIAPHAGDPRRQAEALFEHHVVSPCANSDRGCAMANAAAEIRDEAHPALAVVRAHKDEIRRRFRAFAAAMGVREADALGDALTLLMQGAYSSRLLFSDGEGPELHAARAARMLIEAQLPRAPSTVSGRDKNRR